jgi:hypothetical protein
MACKKLLPAGENTRRAGFGGWKGEKLNISRLNDCRNI